MDTNTHAHLITQFYERFAQRDYAGMIACYHPQITFTDPVFLTLAGKQAGAMWHMLCERGTNLAITFGEVRAQGATGGAHWEARYTFSASKRPVHNVVEAAFEFADGKIVRHTDSFDLWRWTRMALGASGVLLGWSPLVQNKVRSTARDGLMKFIAKHPEYQ